MYDIVCISSDTSIAAVYYGPETSLVHSARLTFAVPASRLGTTTCMRLDFFSKHRFIIYARKNLMTNSERSMIYDGVELSQGIWHRMYITLKIPKDEFYISVLTYNIEPLEYGTTYAAIRNSYSTVGACESIGGCIVRV